VDLVAGRFVVTVALDTAAFVETGVAGRVDGVTTACVAEVDNAGLATGGDRGFGAVAAFVPDGGTGGACGTAGNAIAKHRPASSLADLAVSVVFRALLKIRASSLVA
jgi:hypothetical protein